MDGNYEAAFEAYDRVLQLAPTTESAYGQYAVLLFKLGRTDRGVELLAQAEGAGVKSPYLYQLLGDVQEKRSDYKKAIRAYQTALKLNDSIAAIHTSLGDAYRLDGDVEKAAEAYDRALAVDKRSPDPYQQLGLLLIAKGEAEKALDAFQRAVDVDPEFAYIFEGLVAELNARGARDTAKRLCRIVLTIRSQNSGLYFRIGYELAKLEDFDAAAAAFEKSASLDPREPATFNNWGLTLGQLGRGEEAIEKVPSGGGDQSQVRISLPELGGRVVEAGA